MGPVENLVAAVDAVFVETGSELPGWPDPHPDRIPLDEEYSRVTNPQRWEILAARAEAWFKALSDAGMAETEPEADVVWQEPPRFPAARTIRAVPRAPCAIPLVVAMTGFEEVEWPAVAVGAGDPAAVLEVIPDCACDACDTGSQDALDELDEYMLSVVTGAYRKLWRGRREITVYSEHRKNWSGFERRRVNLTRLLPGRFVGVPSAATSEMATDDYYTLQAIGFQGKPRWLHALGRAIVFRLGTGGSRRKQRKRERKKVERALARPTRWHQIHGSSWLDRDRTDTSEDRGFGMRERRPST